MRDFNYKCSPMRLVRALTSREGGKMSEGSIRGIWEALEIEI